MSVHKMQRRIRISASLVMLGLLVELVTLLWSHPTAFLVFLGPGGLLIGMGILFYLYSLVTVSDSMASTTDGSSSPSSAAYTASSGNIHTS